MSTLPVGSVELFHEVHGSGDPLLLVMGLAADSTAWMLQVPEFSKHYRTIVFDNRGVGRSSKPPGPYSIAGMADDAAGLLDALDVPRAHVVGISMGGMIAQELALRHPERVRGLVLACTYAEQLPEMVARQSESLAELGGTLGPDGEVTIDPATLDPMRLFQHLMPLVFSPTFLAEQLPLLMQLFSGALQWGFSVDAILAQARACREHRTLDRLHRIAAPTLVITGDADLLIPPAHSDVLAERIPDARLVKLPGGSHGFNFEQAEAFNREVLRFLSAAAG